MRRVGIERLRDVGVDNQLQCWCCDCVYSRQGEYTLSWAHCAQGHWC